MTLEPLPLEAWAAEGRRAAPALSEVAAAIVTGRDAEAAAAVALGIAQAVAGERRVAVADLVGGIPSLTPLADQPGLLECLRDGESVSNIGQPVPGMPDVYVLPSGMGAIAERWVFESARWERLVGGFREVDALLLLVAPPQAPGLQALIRRVDGVIAVDLPPTDVRAWPLLATIDHPEPELPAIEPRRTPLGAEAVPAPVGSGAARPRGRRIGRWILLAAVLVAAAVPGLRSERFARWRTATLGTADTAADSAAADSLAVAAQSDSSANGFTGGETAFDGADSLGDGTAIVEVTLGPPVNPLDSARAARFSVELVAVNTLAGANSTLLALEEPAPVPTVVPVPLGASSRPWFHAMVGAWPDRAGADAWLAARRSTGALKPSAGRIVDVPLALLLEDSLAFGDVTAAKTRWEALGVRVYALQQDDGTYRLFAGAFESASQAGWLASIVRDAGVTPQLAYRTGRVF